MTSSSSSSWSLDLDPDRYKEPKQEPWEGETAKQRNQGSSGGREEVNIVIMMIIFVVISNVTIKLSSPGFQTTGSQRTLVLITFPTQCLIGALFFLTVTFVQVVNLVTKDHFMTFSWPGFTAEDGTGQDRWLPLSWRCWWRRRQYCWWRQTQWCWWWRRW